MIINLSTGANVLFGGEDKMSFESYSEKHKVLIRLLKNLREVEEQTYVLIDCRNDIQTDLILSRHGFCPENKEAASFGKKIERIETMMDNLDKERRGILAELNKLRASTGLDYSNVNRKLLVGFSEGNLEGREIVHLANYVFRMLSKRAKDDSVKGSEFILTLVNTGKFTWSRAQELLGDMSSSGMIYEMRNDIYRLVERSSGRNMSDFC